MPIQSIRGTHDILPGSVELWQKVELRARKLFAQYGFGELRTPIFEDTRLFARSIGSETDIVQKEMYSFDDSRGKSLTLRPEGTAPVVRSYIQNNLQSVGHPVKVYYIGPMFRYERPQKGRYRQFHQLGAEVLGSENPAVEAEVLEMLTRFIRDMGLSEFQLQVNSVGCPDCRPRYLEALHEAAKPNLEKYCAQCQARWERNPLRILDCKVPSCQPFIEALPVITDWLDDTCRDHHARFLSYLDLLEIAYHPNPRMVRGLDYYVRSTFEITSDRLGPTQNAILGGGRYDGLSELLEGPAAPGFGFAMGLERFVLLLSSGDSLQQPFAAPRSVKAQMRLANRLDARYVSVLGENELSSGQLVLKRMSDGSQAEVPMSDVGTLLGPTD
jgi:histidyl-tRNA synthetase